jgi:hypothetical protein
MCRIIFAITAFILVSGTTLAGASSFSHLQIQGNDRTKNAAKAVTSSPPAGGGTQSKQEVSQSAKLDANTQVPPKESKDSGGRGYQKTVLSDYEFWLSLEILIFGFAVVAVQYLLLKNAKVTAEEALRVYAVTLIIIGTLFAITAGFDSNQIAPAMGLFGTIAGYLLGRRTAQSGTPGPGPASRSS